MKRAPTASTGCLIKLLAIVGSAALPGSLPVRAAVPEIASATQPATTQQIQADKKILLERIQADKTALLKDEVELERVTRINLLKDVGHFKINDILNATLQDGMLYVDTAAIINAVHGEGHIEMEGLRHVPASQPTWTVNVQMAFPGVGGQFPVSFCRYDWDQMAPGQFYNVTMICSNNSVTVFGQGNGTTLTYTQNGPMAFLRVSNTDINPNNGLMGGGNQIQVQAPTLLQLQSEHPKEVRKYLAPLLERLTDKNLLRLGPSEVYSVFKDIPADPKVTQAVIALLPRLDVDSAAERDAASADLAKFGSPGVLAVLRLDRSTLTQEQKSRCDAFIQSERNRTINDPDDALHDASFLLEAADDDDLAVRVAAKKALEALVGHPVDFDPALVGDARLAALDKIRRPVLKEAATKAAPAKQPDMDGDVPAQ